MKSIALTTAPLIFLHSYVNKKNNKDYQELQKIREHLIPEICITNTADELDHSKEF